nr:MAG: major capsid protein [Microvirus sp.]
MDVVIGGNRLGSGSKMKVQMHNYERSTHDLSRVWRSTMAPGTLVPFLCEIGLNGDTFDINLQAMMRTIPTVGALMGTFKLQADVFSVPLRLYNGVLHNNPLNVGMKMETIKFPKLYVKGLENPDFGQWEYVPFDLRQCAPNSLMAYCGMRGLGISSSNINTSYKQIGRKINAVPFLAYYDIFKNYYANKQEDKAYIITPQVTSNSITKIKVNNVTQEIDEQTNIELHKDDVLYIYTNNKTDLPIFTYKKYVNGIEKVKTISLDEFNGEYYQYNDGEKRWEIECTGDDPDDYWTGHDNMLLMPQAPDQQGLDMYEHAGIEQESAYSSNLRLQSFDLENIDKMRDDILQKSSINSPEFIINKQNSYLPYKTLCNTTWNYGNIMHNAFTMNGLVVKTYQSDLFNNWINTEWIEGENGIGSITAIDTSSGEFKLDTLLLAQKVYNVLNRIAISGGTYDDWQEAVYGEEAMRKCESPIYCGGMSSEVVFEEVISTAETSDDNVLGKLAGRGTLGNKRNGNIVIKVNEPSIIMGIVSITPRIDYTQGNAWYMGLDNMNDLHKPGLDAIGYQELITEKMAWFDTLVDVNTGQITQRSAGKQPAWIDYMTAYNQAYGDFADENKFMYMILNRRYEKEGEQQYTRIKDITTYIDPDKYNYAFADQSLSAQNFWLQMGINIEARRKMSAKVIPNL